MAVSRGKPPLNVCRCQKAQMQHQWALNRDSVNKQPSVRDKPTVPSAKVAKIQQSKNLKPEIADV